MPIRLLIADEFPVVRAGLRSILAGSDIQIIAESNNADEALQLTVEHKPDVAMLESLIGGADGLACLGRIRAEVSEVAVLMFSAHDNPTYIARAVALGAAGYLLKSATSEEVEQSIRTVAAGENTWSRDMLRRVTGALSTPRVSGDLEVPLTQRENEVLKQLSLGLSNKEIALALSISYETVKEHVQHILRKLGVADRTQAAVWAVRRGLA